MTHFHAGLIAAARALRFREVVHEDVLAEGVGHDLLPDYCRDVAEVVVVDQAHGADQHV